MEENEEEILQQYPGARKYPGEKPKYKDLICFGGKRYREFCFNE